MTYEGPTFRLNGAWEELPAADRMLLMDRSMTSDTAIVEAARRIVDDVRVRGDAALSDMALIFDGVTLESIEVPARDIARALDEIDPPLRRAMERSARNIAAVSEGTAPRETTVHPELGIQVTRRPHPLNCVGVYSPGGRAAYPSSVLMTAVPARVAGVNEIVLCSPPDGSGAPASIVLAAAALAGVDRVFAVGGAGAIAAMAFGTDSIPRADRIVGPGNAYVAAAKLLVAGYVGVDSPAGPSELLVIADEHADPADVAAEMLAQAEHDPDALVVALLVAADDRPLRRELARGVCTAARREIIERAFATRGVVVTVASLEVAVEIANSCAPEHLYLAVQDANALLDSVTGAAAVFAGTSSSVVFGDYLSGSNHVLPTGGAARRYSGLSQLDFVRWSTVQRVEPVAARSLASDTALLANAEGLFEHARAAARWSEAR